MRRMTILGTLVAALLSASLLQAAEDREAKVRGDRARLADDEHWVYNDLDQGLAQAKESGRPVLVVFRCIPCEACSKFDDQVVRRDALVRDLMERFVCVRIVQANSLDLTKFQFDYDQSFAVFFMNADGTLYGRFGTRSGRDNEEQDMTMHGFARALEAALQIHEAFPANQASLAGKQGRPVEYKTPRDYPSLAGNYGPKLDYEGKVVQSCLHCHQVREAERLVYREAGQPIPDEVLYPWPIPAVLGLSFDPEEKATIAAVDPESGAARDGFQPGDEIVTLDGQPILSIADVQWVLQGAGDSARLPATIQRDGRPRELTLTLDSGWRRRSDISWRATTWDLRRMATGGLVLEDLPDDERREQGLADDRLALRVKYVGQYGAHAAGKHAGFQKGDIIIAAGERRARMSESEFLAHILQSTRPGSRLPLIVSRDSREQQLTLPLR